MAQHPQRDDARTTVTREQLAALLDALRGDGYQLVGPTLRSGTIVLDDIVGLGDLPAGWTDDQSPGVYRARRRDDEALFGYAVGPHAWKREFFAPSVVLWKARRKDGSFVALESARNARRLALVGARSCDLHAIAVQDRTFLEGPYSDADYASRRADVFVLAVQCGVAGGTCFCASMDTGPRAEHGFDLALTELLDEHGHRFVVEVGTTRGGELLARLGAAPTAPDDVRRAERVLEDTAASMGRAMNTTGIKDLLYRNLEHPRWDDLAARCLGCTSCTLVCPTCFCSTVEDTTDLSGDEATRTRVWDSCFTMEHSYVHGGSVHAGIRSRYRQWLTHKLASWIDQFGTSGCVGCGRCITWCPVGIDITEEVAAMRATDGALTRRKSLMPGGG